MSDDSINQPANPNFLKKNSKHRGDMSKGTKTKRRVGKRIILTTFGALFLGAAFSIHTWPSIPLMLAGIICGSIVLSIELENRNFAWSIRRNWAVSLGVSALIVRGIVFLAQQEKPPAKSHLSFAIARSSNPNAMVYLTNSTFMWRRTLHQEITQNANVLEYLAVPIVAGHPTAELSLFVFNDSQVAAEGLSVEVMIPKTLKPSGDGRWRPTYPKDENQVTVAWLASEILLPHTGRQLPAIKFDSSSISESETSGFFIVHKDGQFTTNGLSRSLITVKARAKDAENAGVLFWMTFPPARSDDLDIFLFPRDFVLSGFQMKLSN